MNRPLLAAILLLSALPACTTRASRATAPVIPQVSAPAVPQAEPDRVAAPVAYGAVVEAGAPLPPLPDAPQTVLSRDNIRVGARQAGRAYWYGGKFTGRRTASGEVMDHQAFTAAHAYLPHGTMVRVTNLANGKSVDVKINDRMSSRSPAIIDLTPRGAVRIGTEMSGDNRTELVVLSLPR